MAAELNGLAVNESSDSIQSVHSNLAKISSSMNDLYKKLLDTINNLKEEISIANTKDENLISNLQSVLKKEQDKDKKDKNSISNLQSHLKKEQDTNKNLSTLNIALIITSSVLFIALLISLFLKGKKGKK